MPLLEWLGRVQAEIRWGVPRVEGRSEGSKRQENESPPIQKISGRRDDLTAGWNPPRARLGGTSRQCAASPNSGASANSGAEPIQHTQGQTKLTSRVSRSRPQNEYSGRGPRASNRES